MANFPWLCKITREESEYCKSVVPSGSGAGVFTPTHNDFPQDHSLCYPWESPWFGALIFLYACGLCYCRVSRLNQLSRTRLWCHMKFMSECLSNQMLDRMPKYMYMYIYTYMWDKMSDGSCQTITVGITWRIQLELGKTRLWWIGRWLQAHVLFNHILVGPMLIPMYVCETRWAHHEDLQ